MRKFFIAIIILLNFANTSFGCCCAGDARSSFAASNDQKACQNVFSFITIDFSFLSPRATAADVHVGMPKHFMWGHRCCQPNCPQPCMPQCTPCSPCVPQAFPRCRTQSMNLEDNEAAIVPNGDKQGEIIPVANVQELKTLNSVPTIKTRLFKIDFFRHFKIQNLKKE